MNYTKAMLIDPGGGLIFWTHGRVNVRMRSANVTGSVVFADMLKLPLEVVCGPLLVTVACPRRPKP